MSYDISFRVKAEGSNVWLEVGECDANITWNLRKMIVESTGLTWMNEGDNGLCSEVIPKIERGLYELEYHEKKYKELESPNGWGTIEGCKNFFRRIIRSWEHLQKDNEEVARIAHFWIS